MEADPPAPSPAPSLVEVHTIPEGSIVVLRGIDLPTYEVERDGLSYDAMAELVDEIKRAAGHDRFVLVSVPPEVGADVRVLDPGTILDDLAAVLAPRLREAP